LPAPPASAEVFDRVIFASGADGWDVTFHPTNQNYAFFSHHRGRVFGCLYRLDPDGNGPIEQGDGCFSNGAYTLDIGGLVGQKSSAWVTADGSTAYIPRNHESGNGLFIAKVDISDPDPTNWTLGQQLVSFSAAMQYNSNSIMVNDVLWAVSASGILKYDTTTQQASTVSIGIMDTNAPVYSAGGKIWSVTSDGHLACVDPSNDQLCSYGSFTNGLGASLGTAVVGAGWENLAEYRNTDGSFGGFCSNTACVNANGAADTNMVNPLAGYDSGSYFARYGLFHVTDQHLLIRHQPLNEVQTYTCWDYTTQALCAVSKFTQSSTNSDPGKAYNVVQDRWNSNCLWTNSDDRIIGAWDIAHTGTRGFGTTSGECDLTLVSTTPTLAYDAQGGSGAPGNQTGNPASNVTVSTTEPTRDGYTFQGWNTQADGNGTSYSGGDTYTLPNSGTDTLYAQWQINTVTLAYDPQGGTGEPADQTGDAGSDVTVSSTVPTRDGYTFEGWNTQADGNGTSYSGGDSYTLPNSGTDTLYAQWQINTVTLEYDPQGGIGEPADQTDDAGSNVTVSTTEPTRDGYTFEGWNTQADGNGTNYSGGDPYTLPSSGVDTLYAQWTTVVTAPETVTLTYDAQGGTGAPDDQTGDAASDVTVSSTVPTRDGYTFTGWNTQADGNGTSYSGGDTYTLPNSGTDTLYAQWQINTVTLTYDPQGGTGEPADQTGDAASDVTVSSTEPTRDGYTFTGWNTTAGGSGTDYSGGDTYTLPNSGTDTLYAQWAFNDVSVTLTGDPGSDATVPTTVPTRDGYTFKGWNTAEDGSGTNYSGGDAYTLPNSGTVTLYAQWEINTVTLAYDPRGGTGEPADQSGDAGSDVTVSSSEPTRNGYTFVKWNTIADGSGMDCVGGDIATLPSSGTLTLYAQWASVATTGAETPTPVPVLPALLLLLTSVLLAALGIRRLV
jgi:uncharacterized repeat protein (TIGR02543 family)